jgi:hypothetical protein
MAQGKNLVLFGLGVVTVAAILHAYQLVLEFRLIGEARPFHAELFPGRLHLFLLISFLLIAAGLLIGTRAGLVCSVLGLICVFAGHVGWISYSYKVLHVVNQDGLYERHPDLRPPSSFGLVGARWWDLVLLLLFVVLLAWEIQTLIKQIRTGEPATEK